MSKRKLAAIVLAAGRSKRFGGELPKVLHPLWGRPLVGHVLETLRVVHKAERIGQVCLVCGPGKQVEQAFADEHLPFDLNYAVQREPRGTGDAVKVGLRKLEDADDILVLAGDAPLVGAPSLVELVRTLRAADAAGVLLTAVLDDGGSYGRIVRDGRRIAAVVEARDATPDELAIREINTSTYAFTASALAATLPKLDTDNDQSEYLFTDVPGHLIAGGELVAGVEGDPVEALGTNTRADLALVARHARARILDSVMEAGVTVVDPDTTYVDATVACGPDTVLLPGTFLEGATQVGSGCRIGPNTQLVDTTVGDGVSIAFSVVKEAKIGPECEVGPFAHLRPGTVLREGAKAGTYAEMKNADIGKGTKVPHFSYLGDVRVGSGSNIGAGTVTCNYDGTDKHPTTIGDDVFIGSDSILVAPVRVGRGAYTGAGSVVTRDVRPGQLVYGVPAEPREQVKRDRTPKKKAKATGKRKSKTAKKRKRGR